MERQNPPELFDSEPHGFAQVVAGTGSRFICTSGQVAWNAQRELLARDLFGQAKCALSNLRVALESVQADLSDVMSLRIYIVDFENADASAITRALNEFFTEPPAATWIGVTCLANPELKIEIEALAVSN